MDWKLQVEAPVVLLSAFSQGELCFSFWHVANIFSWGGSEVLRMRGCGWVAKGSFWIEISWRALLGSLGRLAARSALQAPVYFLFGKQGHACCSNEAPFSSGGSLCSAWFIIESVPKNTEHFVAHLALGDIRVSRMTIWFRCAKLLKLCSSVLKYLETLWLIASSSSVLIASLFKKYCIATLISRVDKWKWQRLSLVLWTSHQI